jgi:hypothetical protein
MGDSEEVLNESLQVEWAKVRARKQRWEEEVLLVQEEMRRVVKFHEWKSRWWQSQADRRHSGADSSIIHGVTAYAEKQAHLSLLLAHSCLTSWLPVLEGNGACLDWGLDFSSLLAADDKCLVSQTDHDGGFGIDDESAGELDEGEDEMEGDNVYTELLELDDVS